MDRNAIARAAFQQGANFVRQNGDKGLIVPPRLATGGDDDGIPKIAVCIVEGGAFSANFGIALAALQYMMGQLKLPFYLFHFKEDSPASARNAAIDAAMNHECGWAFLLNTKVSFPPQALPRLLTLAMEHKIDVLGIATANGAHPHNNVAIAKPGDEPVASMGTAVEVGAVAPTCVLIRLTTALKDMKRPYFRNPVIEEGEEIPAQYADVLPKGAAPCIIDDTAYFCLEARRHGARVMMDTALSVECVNWGEAGWKLTGSEDPDAPQFEMVELGAMPTRGAPVQGNAQKQEGAQ